MIDFMTFTLKWLILACILTQMLNSFFFFFFTPQFEQDSVIKHFANCLIAFPIHICASHVCYGLRTYISFPLCMLTFSLHTPPNTNTDSVVSLYYGVTNVCSIISLNHSRLTCKGCFSGSRSLRSEQKRSFQLRN